MNDAVPHQDQPIARQLLTIEEAAAVLRIGRTTFYDLIKRGHLRTVHIGRSCRVTRAELDRYVQRLDRQHNATRRSA
jgi:excisionase family DNA binding protein